MSRENTKVATETLEVVEIIPKERISERAQIVDMPVLRFLEEPVAPGSQFKMETVEVIQLSPQERISERMAERISERTQTVGAAVPQRLEELQERISERMHEQTVDQPGDQAMPSSHRLCTSTRLLSMCL